MWDGVEPVLVVPSPQLHRLLIVSPTFGSTVPVVLVAQTSPRQLVVNVGTGAKLPPGATIVIGAKVKTAELTPHSSRTVSVGVKVPGVV